MVLLVVKGTKERDEFIVDVPGERTLATVGPLLAEMQNIRIRIRHQLHSARDLIKDYSATMDVTPLTDAVADGERLLQKDTAKILPSTLTETRNMWTRLRDVTVRLWPGECTHAEGSSAAIRALYARHDDPELDETTRLHVYHWRALLDDEYRSHEGIDPSTAVTWFAGKAMEKDRTLASYCGKNDKSKVIVRITAADATAPQREPRVPYETQRTMATEAKNRIEEYKTLEESEVRPLVLQQSRGTLLTSLPSADRDTFTLRTSNVRPIRPTQTETETTPSITIPGET